MCEPGSRGDASVGESSKQDERVGGVEMNQPSCVELTTIVVPEEASSLTTLRDVDWGQIAPEEVAPGGNDVGFSWSWARLSWRHRSVGR